MLLSRLQQGPLTFFVDMTAIPSFLGRALRADGPLGLSLLIVDSLLTGRLGKSQLRPSSEALLRARAPGAQGLPGLHCGPSLLRIPPMVGGVLIGRAGCAAGLFQQQDFEVDQAEPGGNGRWVGGNVECRQEQESC